MHGSSPSIGRMHNCMQLMKCTGGGLLVFGTCTDDLCNKGPEHHKILTYQAMSLPLNLMILKLLWAAETPWFAILGKCSLSICAVTTLVRC